MKPVWIILFLTARLFHSALAKEQDEEWRGLWVDTFHPGIKSRSEIKHLLDSVGEAGFNTLFVEIRKRGDAYYITELEPKADDIAPDFDPLAYLIEESKKRVVPIQIHAWLVVYPVWNRVESLPTSDGHLYNLHRDWLTQSITGETWDGSNYNLDPGLPDVQEHLVRLVDDLTSNYEVDGVHLDYIRYPGRTWGYHPEVLNRFRKLTGFIGIPGVDHPDWKQFRRDQVTGLVRRMYLHILANNPSLIFSAATITYAPGISTTGQWTSSSAYQHVLQDWRSWMEEGILDLNIPMLYFRTSTHLEDFKQWSIFAKDHQYNRHTAIGLGFFLNSIDNNLLQILETRKGTRFGRESVGHVGFSWANTSLNGAQDRDLFLQSLKSRTPDRAPNEEPVYTNPSAPSPMPWKREPTRGHFMGSLEDPEIESLYEQYEIQLTGPETRLILVDPNGFFGAVDLTPGEYHARVSKGTRSTALMSLNIQAGLVSQWNRKWNPLPDLVQGQDLQISAGAGEFIVEWKTLEPVTSQVRIREGETLIQETTLVSLSPENVNFLHFASSTHPLTIQLEIIMTRSNGSTQSIVESIGMPEFKPGQSHGPPSWWMAHFDLENTGQKSLDSDQDGYSDLAEYIMGTHPLHADSRLEFTLTKSSVNGEITPHWSPHLSGRNYRLEETRVWPPSWTEMELNPSEPITEFPQSFFRLQIIQSSIAPP